MLMPPAAGFRYIVQARCLLTAWPEWRTLHTETGRTLGAFIFEDILCRWGAVDEIITDNGSRFVAVLTYLADCYGIQHIRISAYNSCANEIVEQQHQTIRELIVKACEGEIHRWPIVAPHTFWADCITTRKAMGHSPFYMAHGVEPMLLFDLTLTTFLIPDIAKLLPMEELIAIRACQFKSARAILLQSSKTCSAATSSRCDTSRKHTPQPLEIMTSSLAHSFLYRTRASKPTLGARQNCDTTALW